MALIKRGNKHYLIQSVRRNGKVTSRYIASGERAIELHRLFQSLPQFDPSGLFEDLEEERREEEQALRRVQAKAAKLRKHQEDLEATVKTAHVEAKALTAEVMRAAGYHQHRWTWRKKRELPMNEAQGTIEEPTANVETPVALLTSDKARAKLEADFAAAIEKAPDKLIDLLEEHDVKRAEGKNSLMAQLARSIGADPVDAVTEQLIKEWSDMKFSRGLLRRRVAEMKLELLGPNPTAIERHLVDRVMICWLDAHVSERRAIHLESSVVFTPAEKAQIQKTRDRANKRYLECIKALDLVRKRALPALRMTLAVQDGASGSSAAAVIEAGGDQRPRAVPIDAESGNPVGIASGGSAD